MKHKVLLVIIAVLANYACAAQDVHQDVHIDREVEQLRRQTMALQAQLNQLQKQIALQKQAAQKQKKLSQAPQKSKYQQAATRQTQAVKGSKS